MRRLIPLLALLLAVAAACTNGDTGNDGDGTDPGAGLDDLARSSTTSVAAEADATDGDAGAGGADIVPAEPSAPTATIPDQDDLAPNAIVERVVDGDTIVVEIAGNRERVRLLGIDTPESVAENRPDQCYGEESSAYLEPAPAAGHRRDLDPRCRGPRPVRSPPGLRRAIQRPALRQPRSARAGLRRRADL